MPSDSLEGVRVLCDGCGKLYRLPKGTVQKAATLREIRCEECGGWHELDLELARHLGVYANSPCPDQYLKTADKWKERRT